MEGETRERQTENTQEWLPAGGGDKEMGWEGTYSGFNSTGQVLILKQGAVSLVYVLLPLLLCFRVNIIYVIFCICRFFHFNKE